MKQMSTLNITPSLRPNVEKLLQKMKNDKSKQSVVEPPLREINNIQFGILNPEEILEFSVCEVYKSKISEPLGNTVYDERMGPSDDKRPCLTCGERLKNCPGHFGHIELAIPVIHPQFIETLESILNCICLKCSHLKANNKMLEMILGETDDIVCSQKNRLRSIRDFCKNVPFCYHCQEPCVLVFEKSMRFYSRFPKFKKDDIKKAVQIDTDELMIILKKIKNEDLNLMGLDIKTLNISKYNGEMPEKLYTFRPEWLLLRRLPVLPPVSRPPNYENGIKRDDDLVTSYTEIIKSNQKLKEKKLNEKEREETIDTIYNNISIFIDNKDEKHTHGSSKTLKSIKERIGGKYGHIRSKLMGKRVDCSARSVITADTTLELDELGVPECIAKNQSYPILVTKKNYSYVMELHQQNKINMIKRAGDDKIFIHEYTKSSGVKYKPKFGDTVYRQLQDNDVVIFNRQPTLHRGGMMAHRIKILPGKTFRLNLAVTSSYNADFDGDEMQFHVPQDPGTIAELKEIMSITKMIVSSQANKPIIGIIQDCLIGSYLLTHPDVKLTKKQFMNCLYACGKDYVKKLPSVIKRALQYYDKKDIFNGRVLFSCLLPHDFYYTRKNKKSETEPEVIIRDGILIKGIIDKQIIGRSYFSINHVLYKEYSPEKSRLFLTNLQFMINRYLIYHGFTVGIRDFLINDDNKQGVLDSIQKAFIEVSNIQHSSNDNQEIKEFKINNALNNRGQNLAINGLCKNNCLETMIKSGSKGNRMNIIQIAGHLGQNNVEGGRMPLELDDRSRTLFCFQRGDEHPITRGFIEHSFIDGLSSHEFFFHCKAGREGVINTAVKTQDSGYTERKLVKVMEDLIVENDYSVRNSIGNIIQFGYGNDCYDATWLYNDNGYTPSFVNVDFIANRLNNKKNTKCKKKEFHTIIQNYN